MFDFLMSGMGLYDFRTVLVVIPIIAFFIFERYFEIKYSYRRLKHAPVKVRNFRNIEMSRLMAVGMGMRRNRYKYRRLNIKRV